MISETRSARLNASINDYLRCTVRIIKKPHLENLVVGRIRSRITIRRNTINLNNVAPENNSSLFRTVTDRPFVSRRRISRVGSTSVAADVDLNKESDKDVNNDLNGSLGDSNCIQPNESTMNQPELLVHENDVNPDMNHIEFSEPEITEAIQSTAPVSDDLVSITSFDDLDDETNEIQSNGTTKDESNILTNDVVVDDLNHDTGEHLNNDLNADLSGNVDDPDHVESNESTDKVGVLVEEDDTNLNDMNHVELPKSDSSVSGSTFDNLNYGMNMTQSNGNNENDPNTSASDVPVDDLDHTGERPSNDLDDKLFDDWCQQMIKGGLSVNSSNVDPYRVAPLESEIAKLTQPIGLNAVNQTEPNSNQPKKDDEILLPFLSPVSTQPDLICFDNMQSLIDSTSPVPDLELPIEPSQPKSKREIPELIPIRDLMCFETPKQYRARRNSIATRMILNVLAEAEKEANLRASSELITMNDSEPERISESEDSFGKLEWTGKSDSD